MTSTRAASLSPTSTRDQTWPQRFAAVGHEGPVCPATAVELTGAFHAPTRLWHVAQTRQGVTTAVRMSDDALGRVVACMTGTTWLQGVVDGRLDVWTLQDAVAAA